MTKPKSDIQELVGEFLWKFSELAKELNADPHFQEFRKQLKIKEARARYQSLQRKTGAAVQSPADLKSDEPG